MSSRSSSLRPSSPSDSSGSSNYQPEDGETANASLEPETPRPTQQDYQSYTALVRHIDHGDTLIAKRIIGTNDQLRNFIVDEDVLSEYVQSSTWPLQLSDLPPSDPNSLEDSILAFASSYIRQNNLVLPRQHHHGSSTGLEDLDEIIPDFLPGIMENVDQLLDNLAVMRPAAVRRKRTSLKPMNWNSVLSAGMIGSTPLDHDVLLRANQKVRALLYAEGEDVIAHRLKLLRPPPQDEEEEEDQPGPKSRPWDLKRPHHLSQQERERRAERREQRAARRQERDQAKALRKSAKRRSRKRRQ